MITALCLALLPLAHSGAPSFDVANGMASPRAIAADRALDLLPADAFLVLRARSLESVLADLDRLTGRSAGEAPRWTAQDLLAELDSPELTAHVARDRAVALAVSFGPGREPVVSAALPVDDGAAFLAALPRERGGLVARSAGDYVIVSTRDLSGQPLGCRLNGSRLTDSLLGLHIDVAAIVAAFRPLIEMGLGQLEVAADAHAVESDGPDTSELSELGFERLREFLDSAQQFDLQLDLRGERLEATAAFQVRPGSPLALRFDGPRRDLARGAALVDPSAAFTSLAACDPGRRAEQDLVWLESLAAAAPESLRRLLDLEARAWREMLPNTTGLSAVTVDLAPSGLRASSFVGSADPAALLGSVVEWLTSPGLAELGLAVGPPTVREIAGTPWSEQYLRFDVEQCARYFDEHAEIPPGERAEAERALAALLGGPGLTVGMTVADGFLVTRVGGDDAFAAATRARLDARYADLDRGLANALAETRSVHEAWIAQLDLGRILTGIDAVAARLGEPTELPIELIGASFPISLYAAVAGLEWRGGVELGADDLARFVRALDED